MGKKKHKNKAPKTSAAGSQQSTGSTETRASEALTVLWAVTVLMVLVINIVCVAVHYYLAANPTAEKMELLKGLLLFTGTLVGGVSLIVLPVLYRVRRVPPPRGLAVFGVCVAVAPILALLARGL